MHANWSEDDYLDYLRAERRRFAWVMEQHGGMSHAEAEATALERYPYEASDEPYRGLIFHEEAWHWAMRRIHHDRPYWTEHPELARPSSDYEELG